MIRVDQVIPALAGRDAIGVHTVAVRDALRDAGIDSEIYYGSSAHDVAALGRPVSHLGRRDRERVLLYQASIGSPVFDIVAARTEPVLVNYHNITPASLLASWEPNVAHLAALGRVQLERLADRSGLAVCDSGFNASELEAIGYHDTTVVPLLIDMTGGGIPPDRPVADRLAAARVEGGCDLLFVGKVSPHKAPHDLVKMLYVLRRIHDPRARLHLVGSFLSDRYEAALSAFIEHLGLSDAVEITGSVSPGALEAYYRAADVFVCASDHEGFCVPLVEAMAHGLPVVAYGSSVVPETVGDAGIVLAEKEPLRFACAVERVLQDGPLRDRLAVAAAQRVETLGIRRARPAFVRAVVDALDALGQDGAPGPGGSRRSGGFSGAGGRPGLGGLLPPIPGTRRSAR